MCINASARINVVLISQRVYIRITWRAYLGHSKLLD